MQEHFCAYAKHSGAEAEKIKNSLKKEVDGITSFLNNEKEVISERDFRDELWESPNLGFGGEDEHQNMIFYPNHPKEHNDLLERTNKELEKLGFKFGQIFVRKLPHYRDIFQSTDWLKTVMFFSDSQERNFRYEELAETLFLLNGGFSLEKDRRSPIIVRASGPKVVKDFTNFVISLLKIRASCDFAKSYGGRRRIENLVRAWKRRGNPQLAHLAEILEDSPELYDKL